MLMVKPAIVILALLAISGCADHRGKIAVPSTTESLLHKETENAFFTLEPSIPIPTANNDPNILVVLDDPHFRLEVDEDYNYKYYIYNNTGDVVDFGEEFWIEPGIEYVAPGIIEIRYHRGTFNDWCKYYSVELDEFTELIGEPYIVDYGKVVYYDEDVNGLIIRDLFGGVFYREIPIDINPMGQPISICFINNGAGIEMTYYNSSIEVVTTIFDLN